ncbi:hypothetical protein ACTWP5_01135 [Streptomyces sp. 4N509B]|uniref:hypothetical protein n=1 Tax=Streptomyces sp. 4N509B TaxID=3457413 RepID=UPI003FD05AAC
MSSQLPGPQGPYGGPQQPYGPGQPPPPHQPHHQPPPAQPYGQPQPPPPAGQPGHPGHAPAYPGHPGHAPGWPAQPGYPVQPGYPGHPGPPPSAPGQPRKKRTGLYIALAIVLVLAIAAPVTYFFVLGEDGIHDDGLDYTLEPSEGVQQLTIDPEATEAAREEGGISEEEAGDLNVTVEGRAVAVYSSVPNPPPNVGYAYYSGLYGDVADPEATLAHFFASGGGEFVDEDETRLLGEPESFTPTAPGNAVMQCQMLELIEPESGYASQAPLCAWADYDTFAYVMVTSNTEGLGIPNPSPITLERAAEFTSAARGLSLTETGPE